MQLLIGCDGTVRCIYHEAIDLCKLGRLSIQRASYVEPDEHGQWLVDLSPSFGPVLGPFPCRSAALEAEFHWLAANRLG
jgi:hypothetical protein